VKAAEAMEFQDARRQEPAKSTGKWSTHDVQRQAEGEFAPPVPSREVVRNPGEHSRLEYTQEEADARYAVDVVTKGGEYTA
jgi:hypothetical protein